MFFLTAAKFRRDGVSHFAEKLEAGSVAVQQPVTVDVADSLCVFYSIFVMVGPWDLKRSGDANCYI